MNTRLTLLTPAQVRQTIEAHQREGETFTAAAERLAEDLHISRRVLFNYLKDGVSVTVPATAQRLIEHASSHRRRS